MAKKLKNSLGNNSNLKIDTDGFDFGIDLEIGGVGLTVSTENGGTVGIGIGIVGIEYNAEGGGMIDYFNGLYRMEVEKVGCTYVKDFYIGGFFSHTELESISDCTDEPQENIGGSFEQADSLEHLVPENFAYAYVYYFGRALLSDNAGSVITFDFRYNGERMQGKTIGYYVDFVNNHLTSRSIQDVLAGRDLPGAGRTGRTKSYGLSLAVSFVDDRSWFENPIMHEDITLAPPQYPHRYGKPLNHIEFFTTKGSLGVWSKKGKENEFSKPPSKYSPPVPINEEKMEKCCFTEYDRELLILNAISLGSLNFPGRIIVDESSKEISATFPYEGEDANVTNHIELQINSLLLLLKNTPEISSDKIDKIGRILGLPTEDGDKAVNVGEDKYKKDEDNYGFPVEIPDYLNQPLGTDGQLEKDINKYPKTIINNLRELELYRLEMQQRLFRFSSCDPTLKYGFQMQTKLWSPFADPSKNEFPTTLNGIISRLIGTITTHGFPPILSLTTKTPGGKVESTALSSRDWLESIQDVTGQTLQKTVRNQITLIKLAAEISGIYKFSTLIYRLIVLLRKGLGIPWREITTDKESKESGQDNYVESNFNISSFVEKGFDYANKKDNNENSLKPPAGEDIDSIQDEINQPGKIYVKGFDIKRRTLSLWVKLFNK